MRAKGAAIISLGLGVKIGRTAAQSVMATEQRRFSDQLVPLLHQQDSNNDCTSSLGVSMMFDLIYPGASGDTASQMCDTLGFPCASSGLVWNETGKRITDKYDGSCMSNTCEMKLPTLQITNSIWIDSRTELLESYMNVVGEFIEKTDFSDEGAGAVVNQWVENSTNGLIDSIIEEGRIEYDLLAINSIYLNASWERPFSESFTNEDNFYESLSRDAASATKAHFMHNVKFFPYSESALPGYQVVQLPFARGELSMIIVLPQSEDTSSEHVTQSDVLAAVPMLESRGVAVALPKFTFEAEYEETLKTALQSIGLTAPFDAGYCEIFAGDCAVLEFIKQKTFINVFEKGTEAAAVTVGGLERSVDRAPSEAVSFIADHAFQFYIYIEDEDLIVFEGRVGMASVPEGAAPAQLQSKHSDSDFWLANFRLQPTEPNITQGSSPTTTLTTPVVVTTPESTMMSSTTSTPSEIDTTAQSSDSTTPGVVQTTSLPENIISTTSTQEPLEESIRSGSTFKSVAVLTQLCLLAAAVTFASGM
eukprot:CAMPEP_0197434022 /NCGR_PEP_ID=MMETSP1175-20131217/1809_1 /TAXON_ID=1003142 /ORGANISM="Triceratium dubium, Strain CCMP147" /LENGTH=533 /DNA_ID=CAMNT_0042962591 /DNA_START=71 /DNA_END=1672 /DNA_ORIENTATION=+